MLLKSLFGLVALKDKFTDKPLLSTSKINQLISTAGQLKKRQQLSGKQFAQFGEQASTITGSGLDFADRRHYVAGDDPRYIDWKASARSQTTLLKNYFTEVNMPGCIVIDRRASMIFGTRRRLKVTQAIRVGITLGVQILRSGHPLACLLLDTQNFWQPAQNSLSLFRQTIETAARACPPQYQHDSNLSWSKISERLKSQLPGGSRLIIISDFFQLEAADWKALQQLNNQYDLSVIQVIDQAEQALPVAANISLHYRSKSMSELNAPVVVEKFNRSLQQKLQQQADWFKKNRCHFIRLKGHDELDILRSDF